MAYQTIPLQYTPRKMVGFHEQQVYYVIESDNNTMDADTRKLLQTHGNKGDGDSEMTNGHSEGDELPPAEFGHPKSKGMWASCIQVVDPVTEKAVIHTVELGK